MFLPQVVWADVFDVGLITVLLYGLLILFKQTRSSLIFFGVVVFGLIYAAASAFRLQLTLTIFQVFFSVIVIGLIVIFQRELRRFLEVVVVELVSLGRWPWQRFRPAAMAREEIVGIARVAERLAREKIGLLVVIRGKQTLESYLQGGFPLGGKISEPLLESIFDPSSPGHDGAVIIEEGVISRFAVHLPLSEDFKQIENYGTRHSAALGIAEKTDALTIIVSEERGTIAAARDGRLRPIAGASQLEDEIRRFLAEKSVPAARRTGFIEKNIPQKLLALAIAVLLWYVVVYRSR